MRPRADRDGPGRDERPVRGDQAGRREPPQVQGEEEDCQPSVERSVQCLHRKCFLSTCLRGNNCLGVFLLVLLRTSSLLGVQSQMRNIHTNFLTTSSLFVKCCNDENVKVYDRDVVGSDDFMGRAEFDLTSLDLDKSQEVTLHLEDGGDEDLIR